METIVQSDNHARRLHKERVLQRVAPGRAALLRGVASVLNKTELGQSLELPPRSLTKVKDIAVRVLEPQAVHRSLTPDLRTVDEVIFVR